MRQQCRATTNQYQTLPAWRPVVALQLCVTQNSDFPRPAAAAWCVCPRPNPLTVSGAVSSARQRPEERRVASRRLGGGMLGCALSSGVTSHGAVCRYSGHGGACSSTDLPPAAVLTRPARHQSPLGLRPRHRHHHHLLLLLGSNKHCLPDIIYRAMPMVQTMGPSCRTVDPATKCLCCFIIFCLSCDCQMWL